MISQTVALSSFYFENNTYRNDSASTAALNHLWFFSTGSLSVFLPELFHHSQAVSAPSVETSLFHSSSVHSLSGNVSFAERSFYYSSCQFWQTDIKLYSVKSFSVSISSSLPSQPWCPSWSVCGEGKMRWLLIFTHFIGVFTGAL